MPRDLSRFVRQPLTGAIETAKRETRQELQQSGAIPSTPFVTPEESNIEVLDKDGNTVERHDFMLGVDTLGDPRARLKVNGKKRNFYRN